MNAHEQQLAALTAKIETMEARIRTLETRPAHTARAVRRAATGLIAGAVLCTGVLFAAGRGGADEPGRTPAAPARYLAPAEGVHTAGVGVKAKKPKMTVLKAPVVFVDNAGNPVGQFVVTSAGGSMEVFRYGGGGAFLQAGTHAGALFLNNANRTLGFMGTDVSGNVGISQVGHSTNGSVSQNQAGASGGASLITNSVGTTVLIHGVNTNGGGSTQWGNAAGTVVAEAP